MESNNSNSNVDLLPAVCIDAFLIVMLSATLAYDIVLILRLPAKIWHLAFLTLLVFIVYGYRRNNFFSKLYFKIKTIHFVMLGVCILTGATNIFSSITGSDDVFSLHRALCAANDLSNPISIYDSLHDLNDLPALSPVHLLTSIEFTEAILAKSLGINEILFAHHVVPFITLFLTPIAYYQLFRTLRFHPWPALSGAIGVIVFLMFDADGGWGSFTLLRAWEGKCIFVALGIPLVVAATMRYMFSGKRIELIRLFALMFITIGLTSSALFVGPYIIILLSGLFYIYTGLKKPSLTRLKGALLVVIVPVLFIFIAQSSIFVQLKNLDGWSHDIVKTPLKSFKLIYRNIYDIIYFCVAWAICYFYNAKKSIVNIFLLYIPITIAVAIAPYLGDLIISIVTPSAHSIWKIP